MKRTAQITREDGLTVFLDDNEALNEYKATEPDKAKVILLVAMRTALIVASNYCKKYAPDARDEVMRRFDMALVGSPLLHTPQPKQLEGSK